MEDKNFSTQDDHIIESDALKANIEQMKNIKPIIPEEHLWLIAFSENLWGIHKKTEEFFKEYNHPYSNRNIIVNNIVDITNSYFRIYKEFSDEDLIKTFNILFDIFEKLLQEKLTDELGKNLVTNYLTFFYKNYSLLQNKETLLIRSIDILSQNLEQNEFRYISNMGHFRKNLACAVDNPLVQKKIIAFMRNLNEKNLHFWDESTRINEWYDTHKSRFSNDYSNAIDKLGRKFFDAQYEQLKKAETWEDLVAITFTFSDIVNALKKEIETFQTIPEQFCYLFYLLHLKGTIYHRDYLIIELNKVIKRFSTELDEEQAILSMDELFIHFKDFKESHVNLILDSILSLGKEIIATHNKKLIHHFENEVIKFGFESPGIAYLTNDWELKVNPAHIKNIRVWLELIEFDPEMMNKLLSALIINLRVGGIFIFDTDFFQKDVTKLLNSKISPKYKQIKQLTRIFPVFFNEIGAEGKLRNVSTQIDELVHRNDKLIHFLRKQIHTEGNNSHIDITKEVILFWNDLKKTRLAKIVPPNVYEEIDPRGEWTIGVHKVLNRLYRAGNCTLEQLLELPKEEVQKLSETIEHDSQIDINRVCLIIELYQLLKEKYIFETKDISSIIRRYNFFDNEEIVNFEKHLEDANYIGALKQIYGFMKKLNNIIFDAKESLGWENIYYKRHIAFGIPSMYGRYQEPKFDALGLTFRLETMASILINNIINQVNTEYFTLNSLNHTFEVIQLLRDGLSLDGIYDQGFESNIKMLQYSLTSRSFTIKQYINIFQFMENSIKEITHKYFIRPYERLLHTIIPLYATEEERNDPKLLSKLIVQKSENFYRELISSAFIVQPIDNFIGTILNNLRKQINSLSDSEIQSLMSYDRNLVFSPLYRETPTLDNQVFLGSKAYYLKNLYLNNFPVPPGFVITTEVFRRMNAIQKIPSLSAEIDAIIKENITELEKISGLEYGNPEKPLLLSVRSGAAISMPGAMNTFLNVGMNDEITENLSKRDNFAWTSWDCYRRLLQTWGMSFGLERNDFDQIILNYKKKYNVNQKIEFTPAMMREIAFAYKQLLIDNNIEFESDPFLQIRQAIIAVFNSWFTDRAQVYRDHMQIANEWGTAVIVQKMIFGNIHRESGSGVLFTHDPQEKESRISLTGDFSFLSQGEDIVAGLINTLPISENQRIKYYHKSPFSLESAYPKIYNKLKEIAKDMIEKHSFGHQEIEFTFETDKAEDLFVLQTRNMTFTKQENVEVFATSEDQMVRVGSGIGIGNKVLNGVIVFDLQDVATMKRQTPFKNAVLVRPDTVPDDIEIIFECEGLLTSRGGATSHAAVTAATLGKTCVVNCVDMIVYEKNKKCTINDVQFKLFDEIAIDGTNGIIYKGNYPIKFQEI